MTFNFRFDLIKSEKRQNHSDGLSSLEYRVISRVQRRLFTYIRVSVDQKQLASR